MSPACPRCGGTSVRVLAPGYVECTSQVLRGVVPRGMQGNANDVPVHDTCRHRYQVGGSTTQGPACGCGMFAVAACTACSRPLCGEHVHRYGERVVCRDDLQARVRADEARETARVQEARERGLAALEEWERRAVAALRRLADPVERDVRLLTADLPVIVTDELRALVPTGWSTAAVTRWFLAAVRDPARDSIEIDEKTFWGTKKRRVPGWRFAGGSTVMGSSWGEEMPLDACVLTDGRIWWHNMFEPRPGEAFRLQVLQEMVALARLAPLVGPRPGHWNDPVKDPRTGKLSLEPRVL